MSIDALKRKQPEWTPWLDIVGAALEESSAVWERAVPGEVRGEPSIPLLSGTILSIDTSLASRFVNRLMDLASRSGIPKMRSLTGMSLSDGDLAGMFRASICQDFDALAQSAVQHEVDPEALQAVGALVATPVLQAANRRWRAAVPKVWGKGYCPVCGSWPAFAEMRGIERNRYLRCARCGAEWFAQLLQCAFCDTKDHGELVSLIPEAGGTPEGIDACRRCHGYIKVFTRLQGCAPAAVMLEDLASVHLDLAALREGYSRPQGAGMAVDVTVNPMSAAKRRFAWNL